MVLAHIKGLMQYKVDFLIGVFSTIALQGANLSLIWVIFQNVQDLKGYSYEHILFIYGTATLAKAINHIFFDNLWRLPDDYVKQGQMDRLLTKPLNPLFYLLAERFQQDGIGNLLIGIAVVRFVRVFPLISVIHNLNEFTKYPILIFNKFFKSLLTWVVPFAFASFYPVEAVLNGFETTYSYLIIPFSILFTIIAYQIWKWNLSAYSSTGS
jgi:ABC-2 type transport system permease protein